MWKGEKGSSGKGFPKNLLGRVSFLQPLLKAHIVTIVGGVPDLPLTPFQGGLSSASQVDEKHSDPISWLLARHPVVPESLPVKTAQHCLWGSGSLESLGKYVPQVPTMVLAMDCSSQYKELWCLEVQFQLPESLNVWWLLFPATLDN